ncbi:hypothetical protein ACFLSZ_00360 [Candidatus Bipolaricaulota bacterium]
MTTDIKLKKTPPMHVLTVRRRLEGQEDVAREIGALVPQVADILAGPPMALAIGFPRDGLTDFDLAFPVQESMEREGFMLKVLPALPMFSIRHLGPLSNGPEGTNLSDTWSRFIQFVRNTSVLLGDDPQRFIYHEGLDTIGSDDEKLVLEIQYSYHMPIWLKAFANGVSQNVDESAAGRILKGSDGLAETLDGARAATWVHDAIERLDDEVTDERTRACILNACAHHYIVQSAEILHDLWTKAEGDFRKLMEWVTAEPALGSTYWIDESGPDPQLMIRRRRARMEAYNEATDPVERRYHACFCPLVRDAIRTGKPVSRTFCHCSGGWYLQEWEIVFGRKPEVSLVETMLEGADACVFAVTIPPGFL